MVWRAWLAGEAQRRRAADFYAAQIALEVKKLRWAFWGVPQAEINDLDIDEFLLDFGPPADDEGNAPARADGFADMTPEELAGFKALRLAQLGVPYEDIQKWTRSKD